MALDRNMRRRIQYALKTWNNPRSRARKRFKVAKKVLDDDPTWTRRAGLLAASERITAEDLAFTINTVA